MQVAQDAEVLLSFQGANSRLSWSSQSKRDQSGCQLSGTMATTKPKASQSRLRRRGGSGSQPEPKAKPVKKISCQANGLKNQPGPTTIPPAGPSRTRSAPGRAEAKRQRGRGPIRASAMTAGTIASTTIYMGRMSK